MQDFVQMMTQTLHMDARDVSFEPDGSRCHSTPLPEFKLNRKYRDTLMLHGKTREGQGDNQISGFPLGNNFYPSANETVKIFGVSVNLSFFFFW